MNRREVNSGPQNTGTTHAARLRAAVIGCGAIGRVHARAIEESSQAELVAVCDIDTHAAEAVAVRSSATVTRSVEELFETTELDVVTVATPDDLHVQPVLLAVERGASVFCEKPLARSCTDAERLRDAAARRGVRLAVDYNRRFGFACATAKSRLAEQSACIRHIAIDVTDGIPAVADQPFALLTSLLSHHVDLVRWYGGEISSVSGLLAGPVPDCPHTATLTLQSVGGAIAVVTGSWRNGQTRTDERMQITTDQCVIRTDGVVGAVHICGKDPDEIETLRPSPFESGHAFHDTITAHVAAFLNAVAEGHDGGFASGADGCTTLQIIEAVIESHHTGRVVAVADASSAATGAPA